MLSWRYFVVHYGVGNAKLPHLGVKIHEDGLHFWCHRVEVIRTFLLPVRRRSSHDSPPARDENGPLHVVLSVDEEEPLLWVVTHHLILSMSPNSLNRRPSSQLMASIERGCGVFSSMASPFWDISTASSIRKSKKDHRDHLGNLFQDHKQLPRNKSIIELEVTGMSP